MKLKIKMPVLKNKPKAVSPDTIPESENCYEQIKLPKASYSYSLICFVIIVLLALLSVVGVNLNSASTSVSMSFSQISAGHNPDGSPFDIYEVMSDEVLSSACEKLSGRITNDELKRHLSVTGITPSGNFATIKQNVLDGNEHYSYFPNRYSISYSIVSDSVKSDGFISCIGAVFKQIILPSPKKVLDAVTQSYQEYYNRMYISSNDIFSIDKDKIMQLDHFNRAAEIRNNINRISRYINSRYDENVKYVSQNGTGFGDLAAELSRISSVDTENYKSFVIQNGITKNRDKLMKQFQYVSANNREQYQRSMAEYNIILEELDAYDSNVTKVVFIPTVDASDNFYMNRTKIGIDYLTEKADSAKHTADEALNTADYYDYLTNQFYGETESEEWLLKEADKKAGEILAKLDEFKEKANAVNSEYISEVSYEGITVGNTAYFQGIAVSGIAVIKIVVISSALLYALYSLFSAFLKIRKFLSQYRRKEDGTDVGI